MHLGRIVAALGFVSLGSCFEDVPAADSGSSAGTTTSACERGSVGCACFPNATCDFGLVCDAGICKPLEATGSGSSSSSATTSSGADTSTTDLGTTSADGSSGDESSTGTEPAHILFTTSSSHTGLEVGGLDGADAICTSLGQGLVRGPWVAVLRDASTSFEDRITISGLVFNPLGELLAADGGELLSGTIQNLPSYDEAGAPISQQDLVWTGSVTDDCMGWANDDVMVFGTVGLPSDPERWLDSEVPLPCSAAPRLYCVSQ